jgi:DNA-binding transcriptional LysR family regulator
VLAPSVAGDLKEGRLVEIFPEWPDERFPLYALYPSRRLAPAKLRAFLDFVVELTT